MSYGPLIKYGLIVAAFLAFCAGLILYGEHRKQIEWDAAVGQQAVEAAENVIKAAENTARIESEFQQKLQAQADKVRVVKKEVKVYVEGPSQKCVLTPEFERVFDAVSRVYDPRPDSLPTSASAPSAAVVAPEALLTDAAVLAAYEGAVVELYALWDTYTALVEWTRSSYALAKEGAGR